MKRLAANALPLGLVIVALFGALALAAPWLAPVQGAAGPGFVRVGPPTDRLPHPPSASAPLGTLSGQQSIYPALVWGSRGALQFGLSVALVSAALGTLLGAVAGYLGGLVNSLVMRITDALLAVPIIAGLLLFSQLMVTGAAGGGLSVFGQVVAQLGLTPLLLALVLFSWMPYARLINAEVLRLKRVAFVEAAVAQGVSHWRIVWRHLLPNSLSPALVLAARDIGGAVIVQATFTFIGIAGGSLWGSLLVDGRDWVIGPGGSLLTYWWVFVPATLALVLFGVGWNLVGDGLQALIDRHGPAAGSLRPERTSG